MSKITFSQLGKAGRLANQLWQISGVMAYAAKYGKSYEFPEWEYQKYFKNQFSNTNQINVDKVYNEPTFHYTPIPNFLHDFDYNGYLQSPKYFEGIIVPEILFELKPEYQKQVDELYNKINPENKPTLAIHHRFGDYLLPPHDVYHGVLYQDYYDKAAKELYTLKEAKKIKVIVCSDEIDKAKLMYNRLDEFDIYFSEGNNEIIDMFLMAKCNDIITANSSFSYWSALLNKNPDKRIVAPKQWFKNAPLCDTKDLYTKNMIVI